MPLLVWSRSATLRGGLRRKEGSFVNIPGDASGRAVIKENQH